MMQQASDYSYNSDYSDLICGWRDCPVQGWTFCSAIRLTKKILNEWEVERERERERDMHITCIQLLVAYN